MPFICLLLDRLTKTGYWGFPIVESWNYNGSFYVNGNFNGNLTVSLQSNTTGKTYATAAVAVDSTAAAWKQFSYQFNPTSDAPDSNNTLRFTMDASDVQEPLNFNLLSLFPPTYNNRPNGLRVDLMEAMAQLKPSFFRMPGGNNIEGDAPPYWYNWTNTIGPLVDRPGYPGAWTYENTDGLGLIEYMLWAQDLNMEPVLAVWSGHYLDSVSLPEDELAPYVQAAVDQLEFLMGDTSTQWGAERAKLGYPEPFEINFVEVGNEDSLGDGMESYAAYRFAAFYHAIHDAYPNINIMASYYDVGPVHPPFPHTSGDFHEYGVPLDFSSQFNYFDNYTAAHPLLLGEYAVIQYDAPGVDGPNYSPGAPRAMFPFWYGTVSEAVYLLGAEVNSAKIIGAAYAPSFMNLNNWQWIPDMIAFDANPANLLLSTSFRMIELLSGTRITENLPTSGNASNPVYWVAGRNDITGSHILKAVVYNSTADVPFSVNFEGIGAGAAANPTYLTAPMNSSNTLGNEVVQTSVSTVTAGSSGAFSFTLPPYSIAVMEIGAGAVGGGWNYTEPSSRQGWQGWNDWQGGRSNATWNEWGQRVA